MNDSVSLIVQYFHYINVTHFFLSSWWRMRFPVRTVTVSPLRLPPDSLRWLPSSNVWPSSPHPGLCQGPPHRWLAGDQQSEAASSRSTDDTLLPKAASSNSSTGPLRPLIKYHPVIPYLCHNWARTRPMLSASACFWPSHSMFKGLLHRSQTMTLYIECT